MSRLPHYHNLFSHDHELHALAVECAGKAHHPDGEDHARRPAYATGHDGPKGTEQLFHFGLQQDCFRAYDPWPIHEFCRHQVLLVWIDFSKFIVQFGQL